MGGQGLAWPQARCLRRTSPFRSKRRRSRRELDEQDPVSAVSWGGKVERQATVGEVNRPAPPRPHNGRTVLPPSVSATRWESPASDPMSIFYATHTRTPESDVTRRVVPRMSTLWGAIGRRLGEAAPLPDHVLWVMCLRDRAKERRQVCAGCDGVTSRSSRTSYRDYQRNWRADVRRRCVEPGHHLFGACLPFSGGGRLNGRDRGVGTAANEDAMATIVMLDDGI